MEEVVKNNQEGNGVGGRPSKKLRGKAARPFDFRQYKKRRVALEVSYLGGAYQGFARQDSITPETIEGRLFTALKHVKLIPEDMPSSEIATKLRYSRCGRTDRGVSALGQVVVLSLRSCARREGAGPRGASASTSTSASTSMSVCTSPPSAHRDPQSSDAFPTVVGTDGDAHSPEKDVREEEATSALLDGGVVVKDGNGVMEGEGGDAEDGCVSDASEDDLEEELPDPEDEYDYPQIINKALPEDIRVLGWTPVPKDFNARFSASYREYKYFIVAKELDVDYAARSSSSPPSSSSSSSDAPDGSSASPAPQYDLDIEGMRRAGKYLLGEHDFRNFCKHDVSGGVRSFVRHILAFSLEPVGTCARELAPPVAAAISAATAEAAARSSSSSPSFAPPAAASSLPGEVLMHPLSHPAKGHQVFAFTIRGTAFLWHQIRCIVAVLLMVGQRREQPEVVRSMLDIRATPCKPQYAMASEAPLILFRCGFNGIKFRRSAAAVAGNLACLQNIMSRHLIAAAMTSAMVEVLQDEYFGSTEGAAESARVRASGQESGSDKGRKKGDQKAGKGPNFKHIPLLKRPTEPSVEERIRRLGLPPLRPWNPETAAGTNAATYVEGNIDTSVE